jgi:hypothetical protein
MQPIDQPFRFTRDFCVVWALLLVPTFFLTRSRDIGPWYSEAALLILASLFATFLLYGPVLLVRQVIHSGARGRFVGRLFLSIILTAALLLGVLLISGFYTGTRGHIVAFALTAATTGYLTWSVEENGRNG